MTTAVQYSPISVTHNARMQQEFITRMVDSCPPAMMLTELVRNGLQAVHGADDIRLVRIFERLVSYRIDELSADDVSFAFAHSEYGYVVTKTHVWVPKLAIWNTGMGMDRDKLRRITDLGHTEDKAFGVNDSYGIGGKSSALAMNNLGVRYQSCHNGIVSQTTLVLGRDADGHSFYARTVIDGEDVIDVTQQVARENKTVKPIIANPILGLPAQQDLSYLRNPKKDFTEVVLMGNHPLQNTAIHPNGHVPEFYTSKAKNERRLWINDNLWQRWFDIEAVIRRAMTVENRKDETTESSIEVSIRLLPAKLKSQSDNIKTSGFRQFRPVSETFEPHKWNFYTKCESVTAPNGMVIHYGYDESTQEHYQFGEAKSMFALAFKGEMFDVQRYGAARDPGRKWGLISPLFGIHEASLAKQTSIIVQIPDDYPVRMEDNRSYLINRGTSTQFRPEDVAAVVRDNMPEWLVKLNEAKRNQDTDLNLEEYMRDLLRKFLKDIVLPPVTDPNGAPLPSPAPGRSPRTEGGGESSGNRRSDKSPQTGDPNGQPRQSPPSMTLPHVKWVSGDEAIALNVENRMALYDPVSHRLILNANYETLVNTVQKLKARLPAVMQNDPVAGGKLIDDASRAYFSRLVVRYVLRLVVRRYSGDLHGWDEAIHPTALSTVVDCADDAVSDIQSSIKTGAEFKSTFLRLSMTVKSANEQ